MCLDEKRVSDDRSKSTQSGNESELPKLFAKIEIKFDTLKMFVAMQGRQVTLDWQFDSAKRNQDRQRDNNPHHNSFP